VVNCVVPRLVGLKLAKASKRIVSRHCRVGRVKREFSTVKKRGIVLTQAPKPGKRLQRGARVNLVVGKGPKKP
jgi:beta-lactam-binding protein with PASTA domain